MCGLRPPEAFLRAITDYQGTPWRLACKRGLVWLQGLDMLCMWACLSVASITLHICLGLWAEQSPRS